uniref:hypothetical protein n=1 Tax=Alistipes putredinis TaxID=28117 RepID=UPI003AB14314
GLWIFASSFPISAGSPISETAPSTLGDALLLELTNGEYLFAKAVAGRNSLSWLQVNDNGIHYIVKVYANPPA